MRPVAFHLETSSQLILCSSYHLSLNRFEGVPVPLLLERRVFTSFHIIIQTPALDSPLQPPLEHSWGVETNYDREYNPPCNPPNMASYTKWGYQPHRPRYK